MEIQLGDITKIEADALVNAANTALKHEGGVAAAIVKAGGESIQKESDSIGYCEIGKAVVTSAGSLPARSIIHVPTINHQSGQKSTVEDIKSGVKAALDISQNSGFKKAAFPLLGAGIVGLPPGVVARNVKEVADLYPNVNSILVVQSKTDYEEIKSALNASS